MTPAEAQDRIRQLRTEVSRHDELYYRKARPEISDFDYDRMRRELTDLERVFPAEALAVGDESPTRRIGDDRAQGFVRARHASAMTTLENTYDETELREFDARLIRVIGREPLEYTIEPKIDGASISLIYEHGRLVQAITRGDGEEGDDVTANVRTIQSLPHRLHAAEGEAPVPDFVEIRGEIYLR